jgi:SOS-response transcriptional repressor LexA
MLNEKHKLVLDFIRAYVRLHGVPPSYSVIARGLGLKSKSNIHRVIHILQDEGLLVIKPHKFNSIKLLDKTVKGVASL